MTPQEPEDVRDVIARYRAERPGRNLTTFAESIGIGYKAVSAWNRGKARPKPESAATIKRVHGATVLARDPLRQAEADDWHPRLEAVEEGLRGFRGELREVRQELAELQRVLPQPQQPAPRNREAQEKK